MPGRVIRVLERTLYKIDSTQLVAGTASAPIVVAQNVDVSGFVYGQTLLRIHSFNQNGGQQVTSQAKVQLDAYRSAPTEEDPGTTFRETAAISNLLAVYTWTNSIANPNSGVLVATGAPLAGTMGALLDFTITITASAPAANLLINISADLVLKS